LGATFNLLQVSKEVLMDFLVFFEGLSLYREGSQNNLSLLTTSAMVLGYTIRF